MTKTGTRYRIRKVQNSDAAAITNLINPIIADGRLTAMTETMTIPDQERFIQNLPPRSVYLAAVDGVTDVMLGVQDCLPDPEHDGIYEISTFVALDASRQGIGRALFTEMLRQIKRQSFKEINAIIRAGNGGAQAFYSALGFTEGKISHGKITLRFGTRQDRDRDIIPAEHATH